MVCGRIFCVWSVPLLVSHCPVGRVRKTCQKYCGRYKNDEAFIGVCNVLMDVEELDDKAQQEIMQKLQELLSVRRIDSSGGTGLWFTDRRKINR